MNGSAATGNGQNKLLTTGEEGLEGETDTREALAAWCEESSDAADWPEAVQRWRKYGERYPSDIWGFVKQGIALVNIGAGPTGMALLSAAERQFPDDPAVDLGFAEVAMVQRDYDRAATRWRKLREQHPELSWGFIGQIKLLFQKGQIDEVESVVEDFLAAFPDDTNGLVQHAECAQRQKQWPEALARWRKVTSAQPENLWGHVGEADALIAMGRTAEAGVAMRILAENFPEAASPHLARLSDAIFAAAHNVSAPAGVTAPRGVQADRAQDAGAEDSATTPAEARVRPAKDVPYEEGVVPPVEFQEAHAVYNAEPALSRVGAAGRSDLTPTSVNRHFERIMDGWFDPVFYASVYPDIDTSVVKPEEHFDHYGWKENRDPSPNFSTAHYLSAYPDAKFAAINPLVYHVLVGTLRGHVPAKSLAVPIPPFNAPDTRRLPIDSSAVTVVDPQLRRFALEGGRALSPPSNVFNPSALDIHWVIPDFSPGAGGHMNIFRICNYLESFGHKITIWIHDPVFHKDLISARQTLHRHFQPLLGSIRFADDSLAEASGDIVVATDFCSVPIACSAWRFKRRFYFVQDFEAAFYPMSTAYFLAESTYRMDLDCICGGPWLERLMTEKYGRWARKFWQAADRSVYRPAERKSAEPMPRIAFYCRAFTDRRAVELGLLALEVLARRGVSFHVDFFGQDGLPFASVPYSATNHGVCDAPALARIYQKADIGVVFSATNYSIVPQEMMACRLPLLDLDVESTRAVYDPGIVRLATPEPRAIADAIESMLADPGGCSQQADQAEAWVSQFSWQESGRLVHAAFVERLSELGFEPAKPAKSRSSEVFATVVIPTLNGGELLKEVVERVLSQDVPGNIELLCIDSGSTDGTAEFLESQSGVRLIKIKKAEFQHGRTRNTGVAAARSEFVAFLTQDALPVDERWLYNLVCVLLCYPRAGGVFGRHIAYEHVSDFLKRDLNAHFAGFDDLPICASLADPEMAKLYADVSGRQRLHFYSDNNSCLRKSIWKFIPLPEVDFGEDQLFALELLKNGYGKAYARDAVVYHSHDDPPEIVDERCYTEARSYYEHFGYRLVQSREGALRDLEAQNRNDILFAREQGVAKEATARRLAQNKARVDGYLRAMRDCRLLQAEYTYGEPAEVPVTIDILVRDLRDAYETNWVRPGLIPNPDIKTTATGFESVGDDPFYWIEAGFDKREITRLHIRFNWSADLVELPKFYFDFGEGSSEELSRMCPATDGTNYFVFLFNQALKKLRFDPVARPARLPDFDLQIGF